MRPSALIAVGLLLLAGASPARAATLTVAATPVSVSPLSTAGFSTTLTVDKFNVANATLTGITLVLDADISGVVSLTRTEQEANQVRTVSGTIGSSFKITYGSTSETLNVATTAFSAGLARGQSATSGTLTGTNTLTSSVGSSLFSLFTGAGSLNIALDILKQNVLTSSVSIVQNPLNWTNNAVAEFQVTYIYTVNQPPPTGVPAPMSLALFGVGLLGLGLLRRR